MSSQTSKANKSAPGAKASHRSAVTSQKQGGRSGGKKKSKMNAGKVVADHLANALLESQGEVDALREKMKEAEVMEEKSFPSEVHSDTVKGVLDCVLENAETLPVDVEEIGSSISKETIWAIRRGKSAVVAGPLDRIRGRALLHFMVAGYSDKTLTNALAKVPLWMQKEKLEDFSEDSVLKVVGIVKEVYWTRKRVISNWAQLRLVVYDWLDAQLTSMRNILLASVASGAAIGLGLYALGLPGVLVGITLMLWGTLLWQHRKVSGITEETVEYLPDWCCDTFEHKDIDSGATLKLPNTTKCVESKYAVGVTIAGKSIWIPRSCTHNEVRALAHRQLLPAIGDPESRALEWRKAAEALIDVFPAPANDEKRDIHTEFETFLEKYPKKRRDQIRAAYELVNGTYHIRNSNSKMFVKVEWLVGKSENKRDPRAISGHTDELLAEASPEYYAWTKRFIKSRWATVEDAIKQKFIYTGGMNAIMIGEIFSHLVGTGWHCIEGDYSRYDGHTEIEALEAELLYYRKVLSPDFCELMRSKLITAGRSCSGVKYSHKGKMCSGLWNTSFGNTLRGMMMVAGYCKKYGYNQDDVVLIQLGDDNLIFVKDLEAWNMDRFSAYVTILGHKLECVLRPDPDFAEYCSMRFWNIGNGQYVLGPKPGRVMAKTFVCHDKSLSPEDMPSYCGEIAHGMRNYDFVPVLGTFLRRIMEGRGHVSKRVGVAITRDRLSSPFKVGLSEPIEVELHSVYAQFEKIYGFDPKPLEEEFESWTFTGSQSLKSALLDHMAEVDGASDYDVESN
jgi:hypothetical protein